MSTSRDIAWGIVKATGILTAIALGVYFLFRIKTILLYLVLALIMTLIGNPVVDFLKNRLRFNHLVATIATIVFFVLILFGLVALFVPLLINQGQSLSLLNTTKIETELNDLILQIAAFLESHHIDSKIVFNQTKFSNLVGMDFIPNFLNAVINFISGFGLGLVAVLFITFFFLKDRVQFIVAFKKILPDQHETQILNSLEKINNLLSRYFIGLLLQLMIVFVLYLIVLLIFDIDNAIIIAFLCALLNIIPYLGPMIAAIMAALLTMISHLGADFQSEILPATIYVLVGFWIVQLIDNNISQPIIFSKSVSSHPLEIFLVIIAAGLLAGISGMIIAVPLYTILKVIGKEFFPDNVIIKLLTKNI